MAKISQAQQDALSRIKASSNGKFQSGASAMSALDNIANVDASDVIYSKDDEYVFPATKEEWQECQFSREFNGRTTAGFVLNTKDGQGSKVIYYTTLRKILIPAEGDVATGIKLNTSAIDNAGKHGGNVYAEVMKCPSMKDVYTFIEKNKLGKTLKVKDIIHATIATYEGGSKTPTGTRQGSLPVFEW